MDKKQEITELWRTSFQDTEDFINLFFTRIYKEENALTIEKDGKIVSALHMLPYTLIRHGKELPVAYIYAACTAPEMRGQGLMRRLIAESFEIMKKRGYALTVILPAERRLFDYYRSMGYTDAFFYSEKRRLPEIKSASEITVVPAYLLPPEQLFAFFDSELRKRPCSILHTYENFHTYLQDNGASGIRIMAALSPDRKPTGLAFLVAEDDKNRQTDSKTVYIKELTAVNETIKELLIQEIIRQEQAEQAIFRSPGTISDGIPAGMARILDTDRIIDLLKSTSRDISTSSDTHPSILTNRLLNDPNAQSVMSLMFD